MRSGSRRTTSSCSIRDSTPTEVQCTSSARGSMPSSRTLLSAFALSLLALTWASSAQAQQPAAGYSLERFYPSAPGGGWFVMDALDMRGGLGGTLGLTVGYARNGLRIHSGTQSLAVVSDQATASV